MSSGDGSDDRDQSPGRSRERGQKAMDVLKAALESNPNPSKDHKTRSLDLGYSFDPQPPMKLKHGTFGEFERIFRDLDLVITTTEFRKATVKTRELQELLVEHYFSVIREERDCYCKNNLYGR